MNSNWTIKSQTAILTGEEQNRVNENNKTFETELHGEDEFMNLFLTDTDKKDWQWLTVADIAKKLNDEYRGLNLRSESIGRRLIPRLETRIGKPFERKIVRGKRLILCPPIEFNYSVVPPVFNQNVNVDPPTPPEFRDISSDDEPEVEF